MLAAIAQEFSPRYERHRDDLVSIDVSGLERLLGPARIIGEELRREAASRNVRVHVAVARTRMAALVLAHARPGVTVIGTGKEAEALASIAIGVLADVTDLRRSGLDTREGHGPSMSVRGGHGASVSARGGGAPRDVEKIALEPALAVFKAWGLKTLGELAALPSADLASRLGRPALVWQAIARGDDVRPLVPTLEEERFESSLELEWPIEGLEPLSFVLTRLLEPLSTRLERRDRGAAVLHVLLRLVTKDVHARRLELPAPMRDVRALRTLALLDLESHPPAGAIDRVAIVIDPTPGRVLQHTLFTRAQPTPEQVSTLIARLSALMGQDRLGAPATVDSYRPGAFAMMPFATEHDGERRARTLRGDPLDVSETDQRRPVLDMPERDGARASGLGVDSDQRRPVLDMPERDGAKASGLGVDSDLRRHVLDMPERDGARASGLGVDSDQRRPVLDTREGYSPSVSTRGGGAPREVKIVSALRRCRQPVPARVAVDNGRPVRVTTDRRGFVGGTVIACAGPWRTSGEWWAASSTESEISSSGTGHREHRHLRERSEQVKVMREGYGPSVSGAGVGPRAFNKDEWDVALNDGTVYRIFQDRDSAAWFIDAIVD